MKWLNGYRIRLVLVGFSAAIVAGGAGKVYGDFTFGKPANLGPTFNTSSFDGSPCISADGLSLYFCSGRPGGYGSWWDLWVTTRASTDDDWGPAVNLGPSVNSPTEDGAPCISADGLELYFSFGGPGGSVGGDLRVTRRATKADTWGITVDLGPTVNSSSGEGFSSISSDGLSLYFSSTRPGGSGGWDLWVTTRASLSDPWGVPTNLGPTVNSSKGELWPSISADGLLLFHDRGPASGSGPDDIWVMRRATLSDPWGPPVNLGPSVNLSAADDGCPSISADGRTLYFTSNRPGGYGDYDLWKVPVIPIVDFNGDGNVDIQDLLRLIESWGKDDPSVDIGPMPWGDGKVDEKDLEVLMRYWGQEILDPRLAAYWKLDGTSGMMAADSIGANNATLVGNPIWQPAGGKLGGTLQLDGIDDYVKTPFVVDPAKGPFSVFAWVKGGGPGQVALSQSDGANWLMVGTPSGALTTELKESGRKGKPLVSGGVITDDAWHRVGFVWDGSNRILYVDDIEVVKDTQANLPSSPGGLYIGAGSTMSPGSFWSGLIDDVRIYDRAVKP